MLLQVYSLKTNRVEVPIFYGMDEKMNNTRSIFTSTKVVMMRSLKKIFRAGIGVLVLLVAFSLQPSAAPGADVSASCGQGTGIPSFLSSGADPNLLLLLDNSGSMLDMAYVETVGECVDNAFDPATTYTGLFESDKWYKWTEGVQQWRSGEIYTEKDYVYSEGVFYQAVTVSGASLGFEIDEDSNVLWAKVYEIETWRQGTVYPAKSFVQYDQQLYYTVAGGTANDPDLTDGLSIGDDTGVVWVAVESTWLNGETYAIGDIVSDDGMLFRPTSAGNAAGTGVWDDTGVNWVRLDEGYYEEVAYTTSAEAATAFAGETGDAYSQDDLYVKIVSVGASQSGVTAFAASGKLLNWATASKFDIEKKILTGGKYNGDAERFVSQSRGCSSHGFVKEVPVVNSAGVSSVITLSVQGSTPDTWVDSTDDTTRITIMGISENGFIDTSRQEACQTAIDEIALGDTANQGIVHTNLVDCLDYGGTNNIMAESNSAFNHSVHTCWEIVTKHYDEPTDIGNVNEVQASCEHIYNLDMPPATITYTNSGYMCWGIYNQPIPDARVPVGTGSDREGYVGRCWELGDMPPGCEAQSCPAGMAYDTGDPRCFQDNRLYECSGNFNDHQDSCNKEWRLLLQDADLGDEFVCDIAANAVPGQWTDDGNPNDAEGCIQAALWDYCQGLSLPEVIDPTDQIFNTGDTWGMVGALIDSGIANMFETDHALIVMKGYIQQVTVPTGILHEVAPDLRLGAMAFNDNGAATECSLVDVNDTIVEYCPDGNRDGAQLISPILGGMAVTDDNGTPLDPDDDIYHVDNLAMAINNIRATAWTPLAEALYNAIGYYGQNGDRRLNPTDFSLQTDVTTYTAAHIYAEGEFVSYNGVYYIRNSVHPGETTWTPDTSARWDEIALEISPDPVQYWCQDNNILLITEGASTADISQQVIDFVNNAALEDGTVLVGDEGQCSDLYGSTYLDDLTYYAQHAPVDELYTTSVAPHLGQLQNSDGEWHDKGNINTYIVTTGILRDDGTTDECNPKTIMTNAAENGGTTLLSGEDPAQLEANLREALSNILTRASAGSAASVISSSRSGEGAAYQAIFWPENSRGIGENPLTWIGDVHSLFIDSASRMWDDYSVNAGTPANNVVYGLWSEDSNGNGQLDDGEDVYENDCLDGDRRAFFYYDQTDKVTKVCFNDSVITSDPPVCNPALTGYCGTYAEPVNIREFEAYLWSANKQLQEVDDINIELNRTVDGATGQWIYDAGAAKRYIFTWNDLNNDGIVDSNEMLDLTNTTDWAALNPVTDAAVQHDILNDFNMSDAVEMNSFIDWFRGVDELYEAVGVDTNNNGKRDYVYRCRRYPECFEPDADPAVQTQLDVDNPEWRLGDVIHSTPTLVAQPAEGYHAIYRDFSYAWFVKRYRYRRQVVYFGANDGMLHALNAGFYDTESNRFWSNATLDPTTRTYSYNNDSGPQLGDEMWAYVPYNQQPHLKCLANPDYNHKYFVDKTPRIMDVQIFKEEVDCSDPYSEDCIHPQGWGTILIGSMRFGGAPVNSEVAESDGSFRKFISSYFILDITDPERPPVLLGEMTMPMDAALNPLYADLGYSLPEPTGVVMRDSNGDTTWYLVFGNGPSTIKGENDQQGKVAVLPLAWLLGDRNFATGTVDAATRKPFRIPDMDPSAATSYGGRFLIPDDGNGAVVSDVDTSFTGDLISVDYDVENQASASLGAFYKTDAVYFGTTDGTGFQPYDPLVPEVGYWDGHGRMFRLVTEQLDAGDVEIMSTPVDWYLAKFLDVPAPITAAPSVGWDGNNFWLYFGTGRFFAPDDKTDETQNYFFGVKEPFENPTPCDNLLFTWGQVNWMSGGVPDAPNPAELPGSRGLLRADLIKVVEQSSSAIDGTPYLYYEDPNDPYLYDLGLDDLPLPADGVAPYYHAFPDLQEYIAGEFCYETVDTAIGIDGWFRMFSDLRERNIGQAALLGGLTTFTTYQPFSDVCTAEGKSFLYGVHFQTGTAWYENVFGTDLSTDGLDIVRDKLSLGQGLATTPSMHVGTSGDKDATVFVQSSTGEIIAIGQESLPISPLASGRTGWSDSCDPVE